MAVDYAYERDFCMLRLPMGFGKTVCTLTAATELIKAGVLNRVLILAPLRVCNLTWAKEQSKWAHLDLDMAIGTGSADAAVTALESTAPLVVVNYDVIATAFKRADKTVRSIDGLVMDEITKLKEPGGRWHKAVGKYVKTFKWRVGLTGTLAEEGLHHLYGMYKLVDEGKAFGRRKDHFLMTYFLPEDYQQRRWSPKPDTSEKLSAKVSSYTLEVTGDDQARPPLDEYTITVRMPQTGQRAYDMMITDMVVSLNDSDITAANAAVMSGKLQQIANGFLYDGDHVVDLFDVKTAEVKRIKGPKLVVYEYGECLHRLRRAFPDAPVIGAGVSREDADTVVEDWNAGRVDTLLIHPKSGGHGLNMQEGGGVLVFYNPLWSRDQHVQMIARLWRRGQPRNRVVVYTLVADNTVEDEVIVPRLDTKKHTADLFAQHLHTATAI